MDIESARGRAVHLSKPSGLGRFTGIYWADKLPRGRLIQKGPASPGAEQRPGGGRTLLRPSRLPQGPRLRSPRPVGRSAAQSGGPEAKLQAAQEAVRPIVGLSRGSLRTARPTEGKPR